MPRFKIKAEQVVTYVYDVEADTIQEAVASVDDGDEEDNSYEVDSSLPVATEYTIEGQMGWNAVQEETYNVHD